MKKLLILLLLALLTSCASHKHSFMSNDGNVLMDFRGVKPMMFTIYSSAPIPILILRIDTMGFYTKLGDTVGLTVADTFKVIDYPAFKGIGMSPKPFKLDTIKK